ncbi:MAG: glycosyltransferase [Ruminococcus sp.]|nr:glycosyltransferase [Ruminococcus sp.]
MNKIFACLPCYNESENIVQLITEWLGQGDALAELGYELTVVAIDDRSTDDTFDKMMSMKKQYPDKITVLRHKKNLNLGGGVTTAFTVFNRRCGRGDLCVLMDGDNTHDPAYIIPMINKLKSGADCVIASRYCNGSEVVGVPSYRRFLSDGAGVYYSMMLRVPNVRDYTCGYRVYTYDIIDKAFERYGRKFVEKKTFACMMEVLYKLYRAGARFGEVPFTLRYDQKQGTSKMRVLKTIKDSLLTALSLRLTIK